MSTISVGKSPTSGRQTTSPPMSRCSRRRGTASKERWPSRLRIGRMWGGDRLLGVEYVADLDRRAAGARPAHRALAQLERRGPDGLEVLRRHPVGRADWNSWVASSYS